MLLDGHYKGVGEQIFSDYSLRRVTLSNRFQVFAGILIKHVKLIVFFAN